MQKQANAANSAGQMALQPAVDAVAVGEFIAATYSRDSTDARVAVVDGFRVSVSVEHGQLVLTDGIGQHRRTRTYPRIERRLRRIVVLSTQGSITLAALRWSDVGVSFVTIDPDTSAVLAATGAVSHDDARLRRAQALAPITGAALEITRYLLSRKMQGQVEIVRTIFGDANRLSAMECMTRQLHSTDTVEGCQGLEGRVANDYFAAWSGLPSGFPHRDLSRVPAHWQHFNSRMSELSGRNRLASTPINALLNYGYTIAEAECRMACRALGLDPGLGIVHLDRSNRDSLALDLLEAIRPHVDRHVLRLVSDSTLRASDFYETRDGRCRILPPLTHAVAEQSCAWAQAIAPVAERVAHLISDLGNTRVSKRTPLTQANQSAARRRQRDTATDEHAAVEGPLSKAPVDVGTIIGKPQCVTCGRMHVRLVDGMCSWCATSRKTRSAWQAKRAAQSSVVGPRDLVPLRDPSSERSKP